MNDATRNFKTVVIGGGQSGLAIGYYLSQRSHEFVIFDAGDRVGDTWRHRWDSLRLFTKARYSSLPGLPFPTSEDHYPTKDEVADYLETYASTFELPVCLGATVETLSRHDGRYVVEIASTTDTRGRLDGFVMHSHLRNLDCRCRFRAKPCRSNRPT